MLRVEIPSKYLVYTLYAREYAHTYLMEVLSYETQDNSDRISYMVGKIPVKFISSDIYGTDVLEVVSLVNYDLDIGKAFSVPDKIDNLGLMF